MDRSWSVNASRASVFRQLTRQLQGRAAGLQDNIRTELVERVRREIAAGAYDTPARWEAALDRLAERLLPS
jgi:Anti-sigma-28 factor, FlgM